MAQSNNPLLNETSQLDVTTLTEPLGSKHPMSSPKPLAGNQGLTWQFLVPLGAQSLSILDPTIFSSKNSELDFYNNLFEDSPFFSEYRTATPKHNATKQVSPVVTSSSTEQILQQKVESTVAPILPSDFSFNASNMTSDALMPTADVNLKNSQFANQKSVACESVVASPLQMMDSGTNLQSVAASEIPLRSSNTTVNFTSANILQSQLDLESSKPVTGELLQPMVDTAATVSDQSQLPVSSITQSLTAQVEPSIQADTLEESVHVIESTSKAQSPVEGGSLSLPDTNTEVTQSVDIGATSSKPFVQLNVEQLSVSENQDECRGIDILAATTIEEVGAIPVLKNQLLNSPKVQHQQQESNQKQIILPTGAESSVIASSPISNLPQEEQLSVTPSFQLTTDWATNISNTQSAFPSSIIQPKQEIFTTNIEKIPNLELASNASLSTSNIEVSNIEFASIAAAREGVSVQLKPEVANSKSPQTSSVNDVAIQFKQFESIVPASLKSSYIPETITSQVNPSTNLPEKEFSSLAASTFTSESILAQTAFVNSETPVKPISNFNETIAKSKIIQPAIEVENHSFINNITSVQRASEFSKEQNTVSEPEIILPNIPHVEMRSHSSVPNLQESLPASEKLTVTTTTKPEIPDTQATELPELFATANAQSTQENQSFAVSTQAIISSSVASDIPIQRKSIETKTPTLSSVTIAQDSQLTQINEPTSEIVSSIAATSVQRQEENNQTSSLHSKLTTDLPKVDYLVLSPMQAIAAPTTKAIAPVTSLIPIQPKTDFNSLLEAHQKRELSESKSGVSQAMGLTQPENFDREPHRRTEHTQKKQESIISQNLIPQVSQSLLVNQTPTLQPHTETTALALPVETTTNIIEAVAQSDEHFVNAKSALSILEEAPQANNQISDAASIVNSSVGNQTSIIQTQTSNQTTATSVSDVVGEFDQITHSPPVSVSNQPEIHQHTPAVNSLATNDTDSHLGSIVLLNTNFNSNPTAKSSSIRENLLSDSGNIIQRAAITDTPVTEAQSIIPPANVANSTAAESTLNIPVSELGTIIQRADAQSIIPPANVANTTAAPESVVIQSLTADTPAKNSQSETLLQLPQVLQNITVLDSLASKQSLSQHVASNTVPQSPINSPKSDRSQSVTTVSASNVSSWSDICDSVKRQTTSVQRKFNTQNVSPVNTGIQAEGVNQPEAIRLSNQQDVGTTEESSSEVSQSIETLAQAIYEKVRYRLRIQQERHGRGYTGRLSW